jgi:hypothetical protein
MKHPVLHFEIVGKDAKTLFDFYSRNGRIEPH